MELHCRILILLLSSSSLTLADDLPIVLVTWKYPEATLAAWDELKTGSPVDAVEAGCNVCEVSPQLCRYSVGFGNKVDDKGEPTLDAMIMDGKTHDVGAVGGLRRVKKAITAARYVMDNTKHTLLAGDLASDFAQNFGKLPDETLKTDRSNNVYQSWLNESCQPTFWENVTPDPTTQCGPYQPKQSTNEEAAAKLSENDHDTIGMVVIGANKDVSVGTSTNGLNHKIAGRVGDSPIVGSGSYADNDVGGAAATGNGDIMMRFMPSYQAVENMRRGMSPSEAAAEALSRIAYRYKDFGGAVIAANIQGEYGAQCYGYDSVEITYMTGSLSNITVEAIECTVEAKKPSVGVAATISSSSNLPIMVFVSLLFLYT
ncbi:N(4)-(Beta-N-acetylglucosaminyl)-L-asparaginase-like [Glandiceps talaboti]